MASFMSGMAGNVTAFNTVWTYDIYQSTSGPATSDAHYLWMGRVATVGGILHQRRRRLRRRAFNNIMDLLQLVFGFVNAPLFATFLFGMFWRRTTGHGAFTGLLAGTMAAAVHHGLTLPTGAHAGVKGGWFGVLHIIGARWRRLFGRRSLPGRPVSWSRSRFAGHATEEIRRELSGLVCSLTPRIIEEETIWYRRPFMLGIFVLVLVFILNIFSGEFMSFFDLRLPLGWLFVILGALVVCAGFGGQVTSEGISLGWNIDFIWGGVMIGFGLICFWFARRYAKNAEHRTWER